MAEFEYKVIPAPKRGVKAKGVKSVEDQFANALTTVMNDAAADGWEYQRTDTLPCEERSGLRGSTTTFQNMLVFRRMTAATAAARLRAATAEAEAHRATLAAVQRPPEPRHIEQEPAVKAIEGPRQEPATEPQPANDRVQEALSATPPQGASPAPKALTPDLRAYPDARMAAE